MLYINLIPIIVSWSYINFIKKDLTKHLNNFQMLILIHFFFHIVFAAYLIYLFKTKHEDTKDFFNNFKKIPKRLYVKLFLVLAISIISSYSFFTLIQSKDINYVIPIVRGGSQIMVLIIGYFIYNEIITKYTILGISMIISGLFLFNRKSFMRI